MRRHNIRAFPRILSKPYSLLARTGDTIPHVIASLFPSFKTTPVLWLLINRKFVVFLATVCVSYPLSLYRDIGKLSRASGMGQFTFCSPRSIQERLGTDLWICGWR